MLFVLVIGVCVPWRRSSILGRHETHEKGVGTTTVTISLSLSLFLPLVPYVKTFFFMDDTNSICSSPYGPSRCQLVPSCWLITHLIPIGLESTV